MILTKISVTVNAISAKCWSVLFNDYIASIEVEDLHYSSAKCKDDIFVF